MYCKLTNQGPNFRPIIEVLMFEYATINYGRLELVEKKIASKMLGIVRPRFGRKVAFCNSPHVIDIYGITMWKIYLMLN